jgi:hypothetical protein
MWKHDVQGWACVSVQDSLCDEHGIDLISSPTSEEPKRDDDLLLMKSFAYSLI